VKRGVIDVLRRALDNTLGNWPLILIRLAETVLFIAIAIGAAIIIIIPIIVSAGIQLANLNDSADIENAMQMLLTRWMLLIWVFLGISVMFVIFTAIHAFVDAGAARVYVDAERIAGSAIEGQRSRYRVFSMERWMAGGKDGWWTLFWLYNIAWGALALVLLIPLVPTIIVMLVFRETPAVAIGTGCLGLVATFFLLVVGAIITGMWTNRSIAEWAVRRAGARDALDRGWAAIRSDFARHILIALAVIVVAIAGSSFFASFSFMAGMAEAMGDSGIVALMTLPVRLVASFLSSAFSAVVTSWYLAAFACLATERAE
jgi:hypothetical protein